MTIRSFKDSDKFWDGVTVLPGDFESIATVEVGSGGTASVEFTSIPATYKHLQIRSIGRNNRSDDFQQTFLVQLGTSNSADTGSNYAYHRLRGDGSGVTAIGAADLSFTAFHFGSASNNAGANTFGASIMDFLDYSNTNKFTTIRYLGGVDNNGNGAIGFSSGLWRNTGAVSYIKIYLESSNNHSQYSHFALYGIKG